jgi:RNA polymerase sigma factor for flagellar operon FliA
MGRPEDDQFVREHEGLVRGIATRLRGEMELSIELEELVAWGFHGLLEARSRFDKDRGVQFNTFAYYRVRGAMIDGVRKMAYLPRRLHQMRKVAEAADLIGEASAEAQAGATPAQKADHEATLSAIDDTLGKITAAYVIEAMGQAEDDQGASPEEAVATRQHDTRRERALHAVLGKLPEREAAVVKAFYFDGRVLDDIAAELGVSKSWASRIHTRALGILRDQLVWDEVQARGSHE